MAFLLFTPFLAFSTLCPAGSARAAESPAITWPARWKVFLPVERDAPILEGKELVRIPETLEFSGRVIRGVWAAPDPVGEIREKEIELKNVMLDLAPLFGEIVVGNTAWVFLPIEAENAGRARLGMGADWWMQAWLNGQRILDTTAGGNIAWPIMIDNHIVDVDVEAGTNVLAVRFVGGANSATLAVGGPVHLAEVDRVMDELAVAPRVEDLRPTPGWAERFRRDVDFPSLTRIPLGVDWADNEVSRAAVTFGVPFPRGLLFDTDNLRLVCDAGSPTPADFRVTATWDGPDGPARWVLVSATLDKGRGYFLEAGTDVSRADSAGIVLRETEDFIEVDTGAARVIIDRRVPSLAHTVALASGKALVNASRSAGELPRVVDGDGNVYRAGGSEHGLEVSVVERGARRATVRREGWYVDEAGARFCGFVTYTYFHAGQAGFRHDHTLIVAFDSNAHRIRDIQLPLPLELRSDGRAFFAGDDAPSGNMIERALDAGPVSLVQAAHDRWALSGGGADTRSGDRAGGWYGLADNRLGALAGLSDFWQNFPAELEADDGVLRVHLWPARGVEPLDLRPSALMGDLYPGDRDFHAGWYRMGLDEMTQAYGLAKTHSIHFEFFAAEELEEAWRSVRARSVRPILAYADPAWACSTEATGRIHPRDEERFPEIEKLLDAILHRKLWLREAYEQYGWVDFGDVFYRVPPSLWRRWASMFYGFPSVAPRLFIRSGDREAWDFHRVNARHIMDIDIGHLDSVEFGKTKGLRYGGDGGINHYSAIQYGLGPDSHIDFMHLDYYLNGNLRAREVADTYARAHLALRNSTPVTRYAGRATGGALRLFSEAWQATWDPEYLSLMRQTAAVMYDQFDRAGVTRRDDVYMSRGILLYYQLTGEARMRELFLANMEQYNRQRHLHVLSGDSRSTTIAGLAHAFFLTGEKDFLPFMLWQLELALDRVPVEGEAGEIGAAPWTFEHPYMSTLGWQLPVAMAVLAEAADLPAPDRFPAGVAHPLRIRFSRAFYLLQENDGPLDLDVSVHLYPPYASEMAARVGNFNNGHEWGGALPEDERPALIVTGPDGHEKGRFDLDPAAINHEVNVRLPADGLTGTYVLTLHAPALPAEVRLTASSVDRVVVPDGEHRLRGTATYYFLVPAGTGLFRVGTKSSLVRGQESVVIRDPSGEILAEDSREVGGVPHNRWLYLEADAGQPVEDRIYQVHFIGPGNPGRFFRMEGVPGFLASSPGEPFTPDRRAPEPPVLLPERPERFGFSDAGLPWGGPAAWLPADGSLTIPAPANGQALLNPDEGVVELWVRPAEACSNLADRIFLRAGDFRLYRRYDIGVYQHAGGARTMRDLILPPNRWTHLAVMWRGVEDGRLETALFVDGVRVGAPTTVRPSDGWHRGDLVIPQGPGGLFVSGLRVSGTARYAENFPRPWSPPEADAQTRVLAVFDGEWKAVVLGEPVPVLTRGAP